MISTIGFIMTVILLGVYGVGALYHARLCAVVSPFRLVPLPLKVVVTLLWPIVLFFRMLFKR